MKFKKGFFKQGLVNKVIGTSLGLLIVIASTIHFTATRALACPTCGAAGAGAGASAGAGAVAGGMGVVGALVAMEILRYFDPEALEPYEEEESFSLDFLRDQLSSSTSTAKSLSPSQMKVVNEIALAGGTMVLTAAPTSTQSSSVDLRKRKSDIPEDLKKYNPILPPLRPIEVPSPKSGPSYGGGGSVDASPEPPRCDPNVVEMFRGKALTKLIAEIGPNGVAKRLEELPDACNELKNAVRFRIIVSMMANRPHGTFLGPGPIAGSN